MKKSLITSAVAAAAIVFAGAGALAVASAVSTTPEPAFISHFGSSLSTSTVPTTVDDQGGDDDLTRTTVDDHGADDDVTRTTADDHGGEKRSGSSHD